MSRARRHHPRQHGTTTRQRGATAVALIGSACLLATACTNGTGSNATNDPSIDPSTIELVSALIPFTACDEFLAHVKGEALERVGPYGLQGDLTAFPSIARAEGAAEDSLGGGDTAATEKVEPSDASNGGGSTTGNFSTTNTVEAGVDEPDIVKTDGNLLYVVGGNRFRVIDPGGGQPTELGSLELKDGWSAQLLLGGDKAVLLSSTNMVWDEGRLTVPAENDSFRDDAIYVEGATLTEIDLSDPASPRAVRTLNIEGRIVNARMVGTTARVVMQSSPTRFAFLYPSGPQSEERATKINREVIEESTEDQWLPGYVLTEGTNETTGRLVDCEAVNHPATFAGFGTTSVLTIDVAGELTPGQGAAVLADGQQIYASTENLYVALNRYTDPGEGGDADDADEAAGKRSESRIFTPTGDPEVAIHQFSIAGTDPAAYVASGVVAGHLMNEFSMSEFEDHLRVATTFDDRFNGGVIPFDAEPTPESTTTDEVAPPPQPAQDASESFVTVLQSDGGELVQVGQVGGLGRGEQIYGVRFMGPVGYVVTFRQVDPLYTIDLSEPANPMARGELKITGYSAYLHPLADGRLLGVGAEATEDGRRTGTLVSVFDVSDLDNPTRVARHELPDAWTNAEYDYKAFLYWAPENLVTLPVEAWNETDGAQQFSGIVGFRIGGDSISEAGRITHPATKPDCGFGDPNEKGLTEEQQAEIIANEKLYCPPYLPHISRTIVIDEFIYTLSDAGLAGGALDSLTPGGWLAFQE